MIFPSRAVRNVVDDLNSSVSTVSSMRIYKSGNNKKIRLKNNVPNEVPRKQILIIVKIPISYKKIPPFSRHFFFAVGERYHIPRLLENFTSNKEQFSLLLGQVSQVSQVSQHLLLKVQHLLQKVKEFLAVW